MNAVEICSVLVLAIVVVHGLLDIVHPGQAAVRPLFKV